MLPVEVLDDEIGDPWVSGLPTLLERYRAASIATTLVEPG